MFSVLISTTDDHLRNRGFLHERGDVWRLAPAFDLNPNPAPGPKYLSTSIDGGDDTASLASALGVAGHFRLSETRARATLREVSTAAMRWRDVAAFHRLTQARSAPWSQPLQLSRALERLVAQGVIDSERIGASTRYRLNRDHLAAPAIEALANLRSELLERLRNELGSWATPAEFVSLFGSAARGNMRVDSDIDLFVVRSDDVDADDPTWQGQTARLASLVTRWTGNDARIFELGGSEVVMGLANEEPVLADIRDQGIPLDGPPSYLRLGVRSSEDRRPDA